MSAMLLRRSAVLLSLCALLAGTACADGASEADFASAVARSRSVAEKTNSYRIAASVQVASGVTGMGPAMTMDIAVNAAARWPDRLASSQEGSGFAVNLGTGPQGAWMYVSQLGTCYQGPAATLVRNLDSAGEFDLTPENVYNFYGGLADFVLPAEPAPLAETSLDTLTVAGAPVVCTVFTVPAEEGEPKEGVVLRGEGKAWYDPASGLVLKTRREIHTVQGGTPVTQTQTTTVDSFSLDGAIPDDVFTYSPPEDARVVDSFDKLTNPDSMAGLDAPDIQVTTLDGQATRIGDLRGKVVFLNFWATWCPPCRQEMPHIQALYDAMKDRKDVVFIAASSEDVATIKGFLDKAGYTFPIYTVKQEDVAGSYRTQSIPSIFVIDPKGVIRAHLVGGQTEKSMRRALARAGLEG